MPGEDYAEERRRLVEKLVLEGYIKSPHIEEAFLKVPRHKFVPPSLRDAAYLDTPLPTLKGQTISAPHMCAIMCELLSPRPGDRIVEVGTGSGYHAALCAETVAPGTQGDGVVVTLELEHELTAFAWKNLKQAGYGAKVHVLTADGSFTLPLRKAFTKGLVTAACPREPHNLLEVLLEGSTAVAPVGGHYIQELIVFRKIDGATVKEKKGPVLFVPLRGVGAGDGHSHS